MKNRKRNHRSIKRRNRSKQPRQRTFISDGASRMTNQVGLQNERIRMFFVYIGLIGGLLIGLVLTIMNITDADFALEWGNLKLRATVVGVVVIIICVWALYKYDSKTSITNEQN